MHMWASCKHDLWSPCPYSLRLSCKWGDNCNGMFLLVIINFPVPPWVNHWVSDNFHRQIYNGKFYQQNWPVLQAKMGDSDSGVGVKPGVDSIFWLTIVGVGTGVNFFLTTGVGIGVGVNISLYSGVRTGVGVKPLAWSRSRNRSRDWPESPIFDVSPPANDFQTSNLQTLN